ncbi:hypothetical protein ACHAXM_002263 [Skeletonema potamos]
MHRLGLMTPVFVGTCVTHIITMNSGLMSSTFLSKMDCNEYKSTIPVLIRDIPSVVKEDGIPITRHFTPDSCE